MTRKIWGAGRRRRALSTAERARASCAELGADYRAGKDDRDIKSIYTLECGLTGESQDVIVCAAHGEGMPLVDNERVFARPADPDIDCEFCRQVKP